MNVSPSDGFSGTCACSRRVVAVFMPSSYADPPTPGAAMTKPCVFALGLALGAWTVPLANILAARLAQRHYLEN